MEMAVKVALERWFFRSYTTDDLAHLRFGQKGKSRSQTAPQAETGPHSHRNHRPPETGIAYLLALKKRGNHEKYRHCLLVTLNFSLGIILERV